MMLLVTPAPKQTESLLGYTLRVSENNGYDTPWHVLSFAGFAQGNMRTAGFPIDKLAGVLGRPPKDLEQISYCTPGEEKEFQLLGQSLGQSLAYRPLRLRKPSFCPTCAHEVGHLDAFWDLSFAVACPAHGTRLIEACPECASPLTWFRPGLLRCKCGADLRNAELPSAPPAMVEMMRILHAKAHRQELPPPLEGRLPYEHLWKLSLRSLLELLGALGNYALGPANSTSSDSPWNVVSAAVATLEDWPTSFHRFLHQLDGRQPSGKVAGTLRRRFENFYSSMFKQRKNSADFAFLKEEFIRFGTNVWGDGVVDSRMVAVPASDRRFMSRQELAKLIGVDQRTISSWAAQGRLQLREVLIGNQRRYIADKSELSAPTEAVGRTVKEREAAKLLGLPVSALAHVKASGHFAINHMPAFKRGYHEADLTAFRNLLLGKSQLIAPPVQPDGTFSLDYVMQEVQFWSDEGKARILVHFLDGKIVSVGRLSDTIGSILFNAEDIRSLASESRADASQDAVSQNEAATLVGCDVEAIPGLVTQGLLVAIRGATRTRITLRSIESLVSRYVSLVGLARDLNSTSTKLGRLCDSSGIKVIPVARKKGGPCLLIVREDRDALASCLIDERSQKRMAPEVSLNKYLNQLRHSDLPLPRKGVLPNKVAIAKACGFDRSAFFKNGKVMEILAAFDQEDAVRNGLRPKLKPIEALTDYLHRLTASQTDLPCRNGSPNKVAIAKACGFKRDVLYSASTFDALLSEHLRRQDLALEMRHTSVN